jgi:hypothetical protein
MAEPQRVTADAQPIWHDKAGAPRHGRNTDGGKCTRSFLRDGIGEAPLATHQRRPVDPQLAREALTGEPPA